MQGRIRFGEDFEFDLRAYELRHAGRALKVERIPMEVLLFLIEHQNELVTREQIVERIWGKDVFLDTDNSINGAIRKLRQVLRDNAEQPQFIRTVTGQGYRFIASVKEEQCTTSAVAEPDQGQAGMDSLVRPSKQTVEQTRASRESDHALDRKRWLLVAGALVIVLFAVSGGYLRWSSSARRQDSESRVMLAVLPFQNLTGDANEEYFSDGLTEEMISQLGNIDPQHLGVIARTSAMHYKSSHTPLDQIGRELGVQYVIEGSVRRDVNNVRIAAQLIQVKDQSHVWARQYDRELNGLLALQGEIGHEIADEIQLLLGDHKPVPQRPDGAPRNYEAYDLALKGQYFLNKRTPADLEQAATYLEQATAKDPQYARAYAALADVYALLPGYSGRPPVEYIARARSAAMKALSLDDTLPEAHAALALIVQDYDWDWQTAEKEFRRAIELNPNYATAHHWYAEHLMWRGRFDAALAENERARQLDPLSLIIAADNGAILYFSRQYDRAIEKWRSVQEMDPDLSRADLIVGAYTERGKFAEALEYFNRFRSRIPTPIYWAWVAYINGRAGKKMEAQVALRTALELNSRAPFDAWNIAFAYAGVKDTSQTLAWLEKAYAVHSDELASLKVSPSYDFLRGDPRFQDLLQRVGLAN